MKNTKDDQWFFVTNFEEKELEQIVMALEGTKIRFKVSPEAEDIYGKQIENTYSLFFPQAEKAKEESFWEYLALIKKHRDTKVDSPAIR